jgi:hypothetical protein
VPERFVCSAHSVAEGEALTGTASRFRRWLLIEQPGAWGHEALVQSDLPSAVGVRLRDLGRETRMRVLLIKRRDRPHPSPRRCFAAYTGPHERRLVTFEVERTADLLTLDLRRLAADRFADFGTPVPGPLYLVCTHGKHDPCCATQGGPVARALEGFSDGAVWEATHVGGDRFAGNLVCFPHGVYYGRVPADRATAVASAYAAGLIDLDHYRGRSCYPPAVQAAEEHLRRRLGLVGVDDLTLRSHRRDGRRHRVEFDGPEGVLGVEVEVAPGAPRPLTCKATQDHHPREFAVRDAV